MKFKNSLNRSYLVVLLIICAACVLSFNAYGQALTGDVNGSGVVDINDALLIARYSAGLQSNINTSVADVNCDGAINIIDAMQLARYSIGLIPATICITITTPPGPNYVPGEILVGFYDSVSLEQADALVHSYNLSWEQHFPTSVSVWLEVQDNPEEHIALLTASPIVAWAEVRGYSNGDPAKTYILAQINGTKAETESLINGIPGLKIVQYNSTSSWGVVNVPVGSESKWITTFASQAIVKYAQLNYIMTTF